MSRTITALFDTRADADAGRERLLACRLDTDNVRIHDQSNAMQTSGATPGSGSTATSSSSYSTGASPADTGLWGSIKNAFLPDEDRYTYEEGIRRGGFVLTADVDEDQVDEAVRALEDANSVDIDERSQAWKTDGWDATPPSGNAMFGSSDRTDRMSTDTDRADSIPIVEEQLIVGKREVERGGMRVRSYVTEVPVHEQVRLRQERVELERHPVDRALSDNDADAFRERSIEMTETNEEAVVSKTARVVEEVSLNRTADERVEDINETVRKTDVNVENVTGTDRMSTDRAYDDTTTGTTGSTLGGMGNEAIGNVKQGLGDLTGNEDLTRSGEAQERSGEMQQGKRPDGSSY